MTADIDVGFSDILDNLEFGAMGRMRASRGHWAFGLDLIYMGLGASTDQPPADVETLFTRDFSPRASFEIGYRWIDVDYEDDDNGFICDVMTQRLQAGVTFRF